jgi:predicted RNase H-like HicB family nuclease
MHMQYAMIIEKGERNYSAYFPDLPGCIATGKTLDEVKRLMREALELHLRGMREDGLPIPEPSLVEYVDAA